MLKQIKSYRKNVTVVTDGEKYYSFTDSDWNGEFFHATEENEDNQLSKTVLLI